LFTSFSGSLVSRIPGAVHESKISRTDWRFIASVLCAFGMASDISPISRAFKYALDEITNKKRPVCKTERSNQIQMEF
ncbi:hypothetical protein HEM28_026870, partial [Escherichia coli]|nr:hypothetical protein [Escherichia coli]